ncbi:MAG: N-acetylmuramoyl-L-alanine amidase [Lachnospiraceae bacterium]|nr:N-acetylmuramoyl-L-alanine amidase [Lachnospiraceae bacterium]MCD7842486.1 N-acetylmuramoyl-L-alanine amidase [Lachnospiraceae bacterium]
MNYKYQEKNPSDSTGTNDHPYNIDSVSQNGRNDSPDEFDKHISSCKPKPQWKIARQRFLRRRITAILSGCTVLLLLVFLIHNFRLDSGKPVPLLNKDWVTISLLPENQYSRPGIQIEQINAVVVHYVGNPGTTAEENRSYFAGLATSGDAYASSHFIIGLDGEILQCVPMDEVAYCSNNRNYDTISIECCHPGEDGAFTSETYSSLIRLLRTLCHMYHLSEEDILRHYDVSGKSCPLYYVEHEDAWEQLKIDVFS